MRPSPDGKLPGAGTPLPPSATDTAVAEATGTVPAGGPLAMMARLMARSAGGGWAAEPLSTTPTLAGRETGCLASALLPSMAAPLPGAAGGFVASAFAWLLADALPPLPSSELPSLPASALGAIDVGSLPLTRPVFGTSLDSLATPCLPAAAPLAPADALSGDPTLSGLPRAGGGVSADSLAEDAAEPGSRTACPCELHRVVRAGKGVNRNTGCEQERKHA